VLDGRLSEDLTLSTGTWVMVGNVRTALISAASGLSDVVLAGHDCDYVGALTWVDHAEVRRVCGIEGEGPVPLDHLALLGHLAASLHEHNAGAGSGRASSACCCSTNHPTSTPARSPIRATSTSARCCSAAPTSSLACSPSLSTPA
jgi:hypothetical protein